MKWVFRIIVMIIGIYLIYEGYSTYSFTARSYDGSMGISKFNNLLFIPATDFHLHTYGIAFFLVGILFTLAPLIRYKRRVI